MADQIGFIGYGRFGRALGNLLLSAGYPVRAYDPVENPGEGVAAASPAEAIEGARFVILAVPVAALAEVLEQVRPALRGNQIVLDVGSVKLRPTETMSRVLGPAIPWVATHPLFGPVSLALGERPISVVVCPNAEHPGAHLAVSDLYRSVGCEVIVQDADAHDRRMASTHAIAFFVAKGILDTGVAEDVRATPASFRAIARVVDAVRADAGHLLKTIHRDNPFAPEARRCLLDALGAVDQALTHAEDPQTDARLAIPDLETRSTALRETRDSIDRLDRELIELLARRAELARRAISAKAELGGNVHDPAREKRLLETRREAALAVGLDADSVEEIFRAILRFSRRIQGGSGASSSV